MSNLERILFPPLAVAAVGGAVVLLGDVAEAAAWPDHMRVAVNYLRSWSGEAPEVPGLAAVWLGAERFNRRLESLLLRLYLKLRAITLWRPQPIHWLMLLCLTALILSLRVQRRRPNRR